MPDITGLHTVGIPVTDQDQAVEFFVTRLGFEKRLDVRMGESFRWVTVAAPGALAGEPGSNLYLGGDSDFVLVGNNERYFSGALAQAALFSSVIDADEMFSTRITADDIRGLFA